VQERPRRADLFVGVRQDRQEELTQFKDLFSRGAAEYALHRPRYPARLFAELAARAPRTEVAWDCATGNGQAAIGLADQFRHVIATDASAAQIASAVAHPRVAYRVAGADASGLDASSVDVVTVAQAIHWLDRDAFFREAQRVLVPHGVIAVWCYGVLEIDDRVDRLIHRFYSETVGPYWSPERRLVDDGYRSIEFPFDEFVIPPLAIEQQMTLAQLGAYVRTWSATRAYAEAQGGADPVEPLLREILPMWGASSAARAVRFPLSVRAGRYEGRTRS
jgi:ubiquinone/menaquinone biosynthesis C-methylase UbiE